MEAVFFMLPFIHFENFSGTLPTNFCCWTASRNHPSFLLKQLVGQVGGTNVFLNVVSPWKQLNSTKIPTVVVRSSAKHPHDLPFHCIGSAVVAVVLRTSMVYVESVVSGMDLWWFMWVFPKIIGVSQKGWFIMENPIKMGWFGGPTPIFAKKTTYRFIPFWYSPETCEKFSHPTNSTFPLSHTLSIKNFKPLYPPNTHRKNAGFKLYKYMA